MEKVQGKRVKRRGKEGKEEKENGKWNEKEKWEERKRGKGKVKGKKIQIYTIHSFQSIPSSLFKNGNFRKTFLFFFSPKQLNQFQLN